MKKSQFILLVFTILSMAICFVATNTLSKIDIENGNGNTEKMSHVWMSRLPDDISLADLNIPGTHNSGARYEPFPKTAKCQTLSIAEQLHAGVRFFDIRCRHQKDQFFIFHGPINQHLSFDQMLESMFTFLKQNAKESLILSIKEEYLPKSTTQPFAKTLQAYINQNASLWYTKQAIPKLSIIRGKIVLLSRFFSAKPMGITAIGWEHNGFHQEMNFFIQDRFEIPNAFVKWEIIQTALEHSAQEESSTRLHLHFASGYIRNRFGLPNITKISSPINQKLASYLSNNPHHRYGCLIFDFITADLARKAYELNFVSNK